MNSNKPGIVRSCYITQSSLYLNGDREYYHPAENFESFAETCYKHFDIRYPKFYKMDNLSKLGFLAAESLLKDFDLSRYIPENIAINIINKNSSIDTDIKYNQLVEKGTSSPAVFVYTLPNIMLGEICIRHNIKGDNLLFVSDRYDTELQYNYTSTLFETNESEICICGYIDYIENNYEAFLFIAEKNNQQELSSFTSQNIYQLYKNYTNEFRGIGTKS
ncbi:MAG: hypothetical protein JWN78_3164 [Bacteroidota bacterium]|nr:hypothetical protein [Bacteroidota bacterium]